MTFILSLFAAISWQMHLRKSTMYTTWLVLPPGDDVANLTYNLEIKPGSNARSSAAEAAVVKLAQTTHN